MSYAIFRSEPIQTLSDLSQIGSHNKREKQAYKSNPDIRLELTKDNIDIVPCNNKYVKQFYEITKEYKKEHDEKMNTTRKERQKSFRDMINDSKSVVADELLFTSDKPFFENMTRDEIIKWANTCMDFVYQDLGYTKEQVLHATIHMDEKTPHLHCVVVPLVRKFDKRTNTEKYSISKKQYIRDKIHLSELQDKYHDRMVKNGFDLQRGIKNSDNIHLSMKEMKKMTRKQDRRLEQQEYRLTSIYDFLSNKINNRKYKIIGNKVQMNKDTFNEVEKFMKQAKAVIEETPKTMALYHELYSYTKNYKDLEKEKQNIQYEVNNLKHQNKKLQDENNFLHTFLHHILQTLKFMFRKILNLGTDKEKDIVTNEIVDYYNHDLYSKQDVEDICKDTSKENKINQKLHFNYEKDWER